MQSLNEILKTTLIGLFFGTFGTTIGGIIGYGIYILIDKIKSLLLIMFLVGCNNMNYTPTSKVEDFLGKYQK